MYRDDRRREERQVDPDDFEDREGEIGQRLDRDLARPTKRPRGEL